MRPCSTSSGRGACDAGRMARAERAGLILIHEGQVALIERHRDGLEYWIFPGGGVDPGEDLEVAAAREAMEELGLLVTVGRRVLELHEEWFGRAVQHFFLAEVEDAAFGEMTGPEVDEQSATNRYRPAWIPLGDVHSLELLPVPAKELLVASARGEEWPAEPLTVRTDHRFP